MHIKTHLYLVELKEVFKEIPQKGKKKKNPVVEAVRELHEVDDLGFSDEVLEVDQKNLQLVAQQIAVDNQTHEKMMCKIRKVGEQFQLRVKILVP